MNQHARDGKWMEQALALAEASTGFASPNPRVGCVIVHQGVAVGRGAHYYEQRDHAEVVALREAGPLAAGSTAYVTLEPCSHHGRTPPCAEALIAAGVRRVVIATGDPNPQVNGRGVERLRAHGIEVTLGILAEEARALNDGFARQITSGLPFVLLKAALSLDGRIAPAGEQRAPASVTYLTGTQALLAVHGIRHAMDAVLTGIGTVLQDDPLLTDRSGRSRRRPLLRVVLDSTLRLPANSRLVESAQGDVLALTREPGDAEAHRRRRKLEQAGVRVVTVPAAADGRLDLCGALRYLAREHGVLSVMAEGGSRLNRSLLEPGEAGSIADKLCLFYAPMFLGEEGVPLLAGNQPPRLEMQRITVREAGLDVRVDAYLRDPWRQRPVR